MNYKEDDIVLCTIKEIEGTTVFVELEDGTKGNIVMSEVSAGRIRNIREFINVGKKIACKVLRAQKNNLELSLRRVTVKEREAVMEKHTKERMLKAILKPILKENTDQTIAQVAETHDLADFLDQIKEDTKKAEKFLTKPQLELLTKALAEKQDKFREARKIAIIKTQSETGLLDIQEILSKTNADIHYLGSSRFSISIKDKDIKQANNKLATILEEIKERAKKHKAFCEIKE